MGLYLYLENPKFADSQHYFEVAAAVSRAHRDKLNAALNEYGNHGPLVSGVGRDHFPEDVKEELRSLAREVHDMNEKGRAAKPRGVHMATIHKLGHEVSHKFGKGFYGYGAAAYGKDAKLKYHSAMEQH